MPMGVGSNGSVTIGAGGWRAPLEHATRSVERRVHLHLFLSADFESNVAPSGCGVRVALVVEPQHPIEGDKGRGDGLGRRHPHGYAELTQRVQVRRAVLLLVGQHDVRLQIGDVADARVLGAADARDVEVERVRAPVGRADEESGRAHGDGFGQRRDERDDPAHHGRHIDRAPEVVDRVRRRSLAGRRAPCSDG